MDGKVTIMDGKIIIIDKEKCLKCGLCNKICSGLVIKNDEEGYPYLDQNLTVHCLECGHCMSICPESALDFSKTLLCESLEIDETLKISKEQAYQFLRSNRSIRNFTDESVTREEIEELLELAAYAPTGGNAQDVEWIVIDNREKLAEISKIVRDYLENLVKETGDMSLIPAEVLGTDREYDFWDAPVVIMATADYPIDISIALTYLDLYANVMDLGVCWCGYLNFAMDGGVEGLKELVGGDKLKSYSFPIFLGHPEKDIKFKRMPSRNKPVIHFE